MKTQIRFCPTPARTFCGLQLKGKAQVFTRAHKAPCGPTASSSHAGQTLVFKSSQGTAAKALAMPSVWTLSPRHLHGSSLVTLASLL